MGGPGMELEKGAVPSVSHEALACYLYLSTSAPYLPATTSTPARRTTRNSFTFWAIYFAQAHLLHLQTTRLWHDFNNFDDTFIFRAGGERFHGQNMCGTKRYRAHEMFIWLVAT